MFNLDKHPYFTEYTDPKSGVKSYFLTKKAAPLQQHFYFCNTSLTADGKYLWIKCLNPPAQFAHLAVVCMDENNPFIRSFPAAGCTHGEPAILPGTSDAVFAVEGSLYKITVDGEITKILELPKDFLHDRPVIKLFTHASFSCDGKYIVLDMQISDRWYLGIGDLKTGEVKIINSFGRCYNHAMFSPNDPELILIDQDWWRDWHTGEYFPINNRIWLIDINKTRFEPLIQNKWYGKNGSENAHDFWSKDGLICWADYYLGAFECDIEKREEINVWKRPICHCHTNKDRTLWCGDQTPYNWKTEPCQTLFYDRKTNKEIEIFSSLPCPKTERGGVYHLDPHPAFSDDGKYIISTVTLLDGSADVAITPVEPLLKSCREKGKQLN